ncbi:MAG: hypothetical protein IJ087_03720 [Eggerthellaceae bacterium]|nr:hypothetical protein [Eggerthellaceae bacterium]
MSLVNGTKAKKKKGKERIKAKNPIARWGTYSSWKLTADQIYLFDEINMSREWVGKQTKGSGKNKKTIAAHKGPIEFDFRFTLHKEFFAKIDIAQTIRNWNSRVGKAAPFYLGTTALGAARKYRLVGVDVSDIQQVRGTIVACTIELHFKMTNSKTLKSEKKQFKKAIKKKSRKKKKKLNKRRTG